MPLPPSPQWVHRNALAPELSAAFITSAIEVVAALGDGGGVLVLQFVLGDTAVHLERAHGGDDDGG
jgi:hypothetical protein